MIALPFFMVLPFLKVIQLLLNNRENEKSATTSTLYNKVPQIVVIAVALHNKHFIVYLSLYRQSSIYIYFHIKTPLH